ncbi:Bro-N domain-containing protein, partial [Rodentibacter pneumotropicus]
MSNLTIFNFENTPVQTIVENNEIFFRAAQLAELLEYKNPHDALKKHVDPDDLAKREIVNTVNKRAQVLFVNESGMYSLILSSKLESAKRVKRWVTSEILPQIRKTGKYQLKPKQLALPEPEKKFTF